MSFIDLHRKSFRNVLAKLSILLITVFIISSCSNDSTNPINPGNTSIISGTVTGYPGGSIIAKAPLVKSSPIDSFFAGIDTIDNDAVLKMDLSTPPTDFLLKIGVGPEVTVSDTSARVNYFSVLRVYNYSGAHIGNIGYKNFNDTVVAGSFSIQYLYSSKPVSIIGSDSSISVTDTTIAVYNVNFASGWNVITFFVAEIRTTYNRTEIRNGVTAGATWRYEPSTLDRFMFRDFLRLD